MASPEISNETSSLSNMHLASLREGSGISDEAIQSRGYRTITSAKELMELGFSRNQARHVPGLLLPLHTTDGGNGLAVYRPDNPRVIEDKRKRHPDGTYHQKIIKYELPKGSSIQLDCPPVCRPMLKNPKIPFFITEGQKKADALASRGLCAIALLGVWNFKGKNNLGGTVLLADFDYIALGGRDVRIIFDSDTMTKSDVRKALERLTEHLQRKGAHVAAVYLPSGPKGKVGVDDWLAAGHTIEELEALVEAPRPEPKAAVPLVELLDEAPRAIRRPLALVDGVAYAATWLWTRVTTMETINKEGEIFKHDPPIVASERRPFVIRDDGVIFGEGGDKPFDELGLEVDLGDPPPDEMTWATAGVLAYRDGRRPDPADVFERVAKVFDHFLDFSRSLASQEQMSRLSACFSLMTFFSDAFTVMPYPWPNSPAPGSGKTKWGHCWTKTSYLGYLTSAAGSFAALRDLAEMGATLLFDDAEVLADAQKADPDKQALVLAGNRKGVKIALKEQGPDRRWRTRWVNAYCPRGFTALRLPFGALQSRSTVIPLVASADAARANRDVENASDWPISQRDLLADLWAVGLALQREASDTWSDLSDEALNVGRDWERWRAIIAVARLFELHGVRNLEADMRDVMRAYHDQKADIEDTSRIGLIIRALMCVVGLQDSDTWTLSDTSDTCSERQKITATQILEKLQSILAEEESDSEWANTTVVGKMLSKLRLERDRDAGKKRSRYRVISQAEVLKLAIAHSVVRLSEHVSDVSESVRRVRNGHQPGGGGEPWTSESF